MNQIRKLFVVAAIAAASASTATADLVVFRSGARLTGSVVRIEGGTITFKSDDVGEVKVAQDKVAALKTEKANTILYTDKTREEAVVNMTNGQYTASGKALDMANVKAVNPAVETWHGSVNASAAAARGNTRSETVTLLADLSRRWEKDRLNSNFGYYFAQSGRNGKDKEKTDDRIELAAQEDHFWTGWFYSYVNGKYERDGINNLQYRYRVGVGPGIQWLDGKVFETTGKWSFNQEVGLTYVREKYEHHADDDRCAFRYAHHLAWAPRWVDNLAFTHNLEYLPDTEDWADSYLLDTDVGFTYAFTAAWQLLGKIEWDYNSNPPGETKRTDVRYVFGLGYKW